MVTRNRPKAGFGRGDQSPLAPVSYTHLDVYKRQNQNDEIVATYDVLTLVSKTPELAAAE